MSLTNRLASVAGAAAISLTPAMAQSNTTETDATPPPAKVQQADASWYQTAWNYTGGAVGAGIGYVGTGLSKLGEGITWTAEHSVLYPVRGVAKGANFISNKIDEGFTWVEGKTGIPTKTASDIVSMPSSFVHTITDNAADFVAEGPKAALGVTGSTLGIVGNTVAADTKGIQSSAKDLAGNSWDLVKTSVGDAGVLALSAVGTASMPIPFTGIARDTITVANRAGDLAAGNADLSKPVPRDVVAATKYSYDKVVYGKEAADEVKGALFVSAGDVKATKDLSTNQEKPQPPKTGEPTGPKKAANSQLNPSLLNRLATERNI